MDKMFKVFTLSFAILIFSAPVWAQTTNFSARSDNASTPEDIEQATQEELQYQLTLAQSAPDNTYVDPLRYTLGPDDVVEIIVMRHPEFSGTYPVNLEGKIQYKFVGDLEVSGLTKKELERAIKDIIGKFIIEPEVNVTILEYKSKIIYVLGEVGRPGKYFMRSESIPVREAVVQAGLPTLAAAMRRCRLITPSADGKIKTKNIDLYAILYSGNLKNNTEMKPGDVLYVPATVMAKIMRVISPVAAPATTAASGVASGGALVP